jgi:LDH2 family malate/lactate/ureidoglycolate dehydrogenase
MATEAISRGEVIARGLRGDPLPPGAAVDADGRPTTDPVAAAAISPFSGAKGFALGLTIELIVAALTGTAVGAEVRGTLDVTDPVTKGDLLIVFDARHEVQPPGAQSGADRGRLAPWAPRPPPAGPSPRSPHWPATSASRRA